MHIQKKGEIGLRASPSLDVAAVVYEISVDKKVWDFTWFQNGCTPLKLFDDVTSSSGEIKS